MYIRNEFKKNFIFVQLQSNSLIVNVTTMYTSTKKGINYPFLFNYIEIFGPVESNSLFLNTVLVFLDFTKAFPCI